MVSTDHMMFGTFSVLGAISVVIYNIASSTTTQVTSSRNPDYVYLQRKFFLVYFLALLADWLQGPYVYQLYYFYGFNESEIAILYLVGFAASILFGTATGPLSDRFGRKLLCVVFTILYSLCCVTKLSSDFYILLLGRILGGISTSILFSSFESWYVYEHVEKFGFPMEWISVTLSIATYFNGVLAIIAGVLANFVAETLHYGPVAPFMLSIPCLLLAGGLALTTWSENKGNSNFTASWMEALKIIVNDRNILYLGIIQSLFESVMYIFVFLWTPVLEPLNAPLGIVFSCFMIAVMIGSSFYTLLMNKNISSEKILIISCVIAFFAIFLCTVSLPIVSFLLFLCLEIAVGLYFPAIGSLRSEILPEMYRANLINWFRVPMNFITCGGLFWLHWHTKQNYGNSNEKLFAFCAFLMFVSVIISVKFVKNLNKFKLANVLVDSDEKQTSAEIETI